MIVLCLSEEPVECSPKDIGRPNTQHTANAIAASLLGKLHVPSTHQRVALLRLFYFFAATRIDTPDQRSCPNPGGGVAFKGITPTFFVVNGYRASR